MDLRDDYGCFFIQIKQPREVGFVIYVKTNYLLKHHPKFKLNYFDDKTKKMATKQFSRNHLFYYGFSGKDCVGGEAIQEYTLDEFKKLFRKNVEGLYNYNEYPSSDELYATMKSSKPGISRDFTKKWFEEQYQFIEKEFKSFDKTRPSVATTTATATATTAVSRRHTSTSKHRRTIKSKSRKTRRQ